MSQIIECPSNFTTKPLPQVNFVNLIIFSFVIMQVRQIFDIANQGIVCF